jgi:hypothetical protein
MQSSCGIGKIGFIAFWIKQGGGRQADRGSDAAKLPVCQWSKREKCERRTMNF